MFSFLCDSIHKENQPVYANTTEWFWKWCQEVYDFKDEMDDGACCESWEAAGNLGK